MFKKLDYADISRIKSFISPQRIFEGHTIPDDYFHDEMGEIFGSPELLVMAKTEEEVSALLAYANQMRIPVVPRGTGTGLVGGAVAHLGGIILDLSLMNRIISIDERNFIAHVESGVLLMDLAKATEEKGLLYPPDPGEKSATIGGNISTNAGGMRAVKYGVTRDFVLELRAVLADGSIETFGGGVMKNSSGFSVKDLICGSEGTLAVITSAKLKLVPLPQLSLSLLAPFPTAKQAIEAVSPLLLAGADITALEFLTRECLSLADSYLGRPFPEINEEYALLVSIDGNDKGDLDKRCDALCEAALALGATDVFMADTLERKESVWGTRGAFLEAIKAEARGMDECDVVVVPSLMAEFSEEIAKVSKQLNVKMPFFGHAGDGNLHIYFMREHMDEHRWQEVLTAGFDALYAKAKELGGLVSGEHGIGLAKKEYLARSVGHNQIKLMGRIKTAFDPKGILNPGKIV